MSQVASVSGHEPVCAATATATVTTTATPAAAAAAAALTSSEHNETREYEKIIQFRDTVVSGNHPRIKVPASSVVKHASTTQPPPSNTPERVAPSTQLPVNSIDANGHSLGNMLSFKANSQQPAVTIPPASSVPFIPGVSRPFGSGKPEINPILLQKSDGLVKAEIQIQRQRLEKVLKDQVEERRSSIRGSIQPSEQLSELDISDILAKALTLVQATAPPASSALPSPTANASDASDSFDERTFYSSQHDTPESRPSPRNALGNVQVQDGPISARQTGNYAPPVEPLASHSLPSSTSHLPRTDVARNITQGQIMDAQRKHPATATAPIQSRGIIAISSIGTQSPSNQGHQTKRLETQVINSDSRDASRSDNSGNTDSEQSADHHGLQNPPQLVSNTGFRQHEEPLIRGHNLSPFAPQPAHVSPLAVARQPRIRESDNGALQRAPPQVTALRQEHTVVISPESSPQGEKGGKKKNKKKNKRKADARVQDTQDSPNIKPEPRSPSPLTAPPFIRPQKRPRRFGRQEPEIIYDDEIGEGPSSQLQQDRYPPAPVHADRISHGYEGVDDPYSRQAHPSVGPVTHRLESPLYEERRSDGSIIRYVRRIPSPLGYPSPYGAVDYRPIRTASYTVANTDPREIPPYQREGRMSVRPYGDRARSRSPIALERRSSAMPPPSAPPRRIVIDEYGREYIEPIRTASRQSVVPPGRPGDHEVVYERAPPIRATSRIPAPEIIGEDGVIYRRASPSYAHRRVITQPDYDIGFRSYRERDYPVQSMGHPSQEFVQIRGPAELVSQEYLSRAASVRPVESMPYDRLGSTRPDIPPRQYAASVHPDARREIAPHVGRDYSVRPTEMEIPQPAYGVRQVERHYELSPREGDITYVERPRAVRQEVVYQGNAPRQVYQ